jgi:hypothetical protein
LRCRSEFSYTFTQIVLVRFVSRCGDQLCATDYFLFVAYFRHRAVQRVNKAIVAAGDRLAKNEDKFGLRQQADTALARLLVLKVVACLLDPGASANSTA